MACRISIDSAIAAAAVLGPFYEGESSSLDIEKSLEQKVIEIQRISTMEVTPVFQVAICE
jgi:hypothetical protein